MKNLNQTTNRALATTIPATIPATTVMRVAIAMVSGATILLLAACKTEPPSEGTPAGSSPKTSMSKTGTRVEVAAVVEHQNTMRIVRPGEIEGAREAKLAAALGGFVERVMVKTGASVRKNTPIVYVDTSTFAAQARLTQVEVDEATRELARVKGLGKAIASARVDAAESRLARAQAQHALSKTRQRRAVIRAPFSGVIVGLDVERGEVLAPGAPVARLIKLDPLSVKVSVADRDVVALKVGGRARVTSNASTTPVLGVIARIDPAADLATRTFTVEVEIANPERRLLPGMVAEVEFTGQASNDNSLLLPQDLLVTRREGNGVFVLDDKTVHWRELTLGGIVGTDVEIVSGLSSGEVIVVLGHRGLDDGDEVIVTRRGTCCTNGRVVYSDPNKAKEQKENKKREHGKTEEQAAIKQKSTHRGESQ